MQFLIGSKTLVALGSGALLESTFEEFILTKKAAIFYDWLTIPFKLRVTSPHGTRIPDIALIAPDFEAWWVIEVELAHHSLEAHVIPQVTAFREGFYGAEHLNWMVRLLGEKHRSELVSMVRDRDPGVHVVVNQEVPQWTSALAMLDVTVSYVEMYRSNEGELGARIGGSMPRRRPRRRVRAVRNAALPKTYRLPDPGFLSALGYEFEIVVDGHVTSWLRPSLDSDTILPRGNDPFIGRKSFMCFLDQHEQISASLDWPDI